MVVKSFLHYLKYSHQKWFFLVFIVLFVLPSFAHLLSFDISYFKSVEDSDLIFEGDASVSSGAVVLIPNKTTEYHAGRATYKNFMTLWDSSTKKLADFNTHFSFTIDKYSDSTQLSDGIVFFLAAVDFPVPLHSAGGFLGLFNTSSLADSYQIVQVEFDTYLNDWDPSVQHIGINTGSLFSVAYAPWEANSNVGRKAYVRINYNSTTKNLSVFCTYNSDSVYMSSPNVSYEIDLMKVLPEKVMIGFSASTGQIMQKYSLNSWHFNSNLDSINEKVKHLNKRNKILVLLPVVCFLLLTVGIGYFFIAKNMRAKTAARKSFASGLAEHLEIGTLLKRFTYKKLEIATQNFADHLKLGQGGSGSVYKGELNDANRLQVAVKTIFAESANSEKIFVNEVKIISRLVHKSLLQCLGWCHEQGKFLLVYEYMPNGSLDTFLFGNSNRGTLPWHVRFKIALGLASGIHYLHEESGQCVIHRDIKPANVLLDTDFNPKIGDFGIAKLVDPRLKTQTTGVVGTFGYLAPEYTSEGRASKQSDMFSFGIVALEIACGRRTYQVGDFYMPLVKWVWQLYVAGNLLKAADEKLNGEFDREEMECLLMVGLCCSNPKGNERPNAEHVIKVLQFEAPMPKIARDAHDSTFPHEQPDILQNESVVVDISSSIHLGR